MRGFVRELVPMAADLNTFAGGRLNQVNWSAATPGIHITTLYRKRKRYKLDLIAASRAK
jgi:hypothetical protein